MLRLFYGFLIVLVLSGSVYAEDPDVLIDEVPTNNPPAPEVPAVVEPVVPVPVTRSGYWFLETWGTAAYNSSAYQENRGGSYGKVITRVQPRLGYAFPFFIEGMTIDPYVGGELVYGGDDEYYFNYLANAVGFRIKLLKAVDDPNNWGVFFKDLEFYTEYSGQYILNDSGPHISAAFGAPYKQVNDGRMNDFIFGLRNYKEGWDEHLWWDNFLRFTHNTTNFQRPDYNGWLFLANGKLGYNLLNNASDRTSQPWNIGPYAKFETFKNFVGNSAYNFEYENRLEYGIGFQVRYNLKAENVSSAWVRGFVEYLNVAYYDKKPGDTSTPGNNLLIGVEFWNR